jgi:mRNA interferase MazF
MLKTPLRIRHVVSVNLPLRYPPGHEQVGFRPAIIVGYPNYLGIPRFSLVAIVPMSGFDQTKEFREWWVTRSPSLYPVFDAGVGGLETKSIALLDQLTTVDVNRISKRYGRLTDIEYEPIIKGIQTMIAIPATK